MSKLLFGIIAQTAVYIGVKDKAKELILTALKTGKIREFVKSTDTKYDDVALDVLVFVIETHWSTMWDNVIAVVKGKSDTSRRLTADKFSSALQKAIKKEDKRRQTADGRRQQNGGKIRKITA